MVSSLRHRDSGYRLGTRQGGKEGVVTRVPEAFNSAPMHINYNLSPTVWAKSIFYRWNRQVRDIIGTRLPT